MSEEKSQLNELKIQSLGVIESAAIEFGPGLNVLTGETGAGKTMVLTALSLICGGKSDSDLVRTGAQRLTASARFQTSTSEPLNNILKELDTELEDGELLITRGVTLDGKSRASLGGTAATAANLSTVTEELIAIHGQSANAKLNKSSKQRELLDRFGGNEISVHLTKYQNKYLDVKNLARQVHDLKLALKERDKELETLKEFADSINKVKPLPGELIDIENEISRLDSVEDIRIGAASAQELLSGDEQNVLTQLIAARKNLEGIKGKDAALDEIAEKFAENLLDLQDLASELSRYMSALDADPRRLEFLQERKAAMNSLIKKFGKGSDRMAAYENLITEAESISRHIKDLQGGDSRVAELEGERDKAFAELKRISKVLSQQREQVGEKLGSAVTKEIRELSMPQATFKVKIVVGEGERFSEFTEYGIDEIEMVFSSHSDGPLLPIAKAASGGELSRLMLGIEVVIAGSDPVGTYVFDEVDAGVGGKAAIEVGRRLAKLARETQVIVVTHLAQVAVWADHHFVVAKNESGSITESSVIRVADADREREIARMLSGQSESEIAQQHAKELLALIRS